MLSFYLSLQITPGSFLNSNSTLSPLKGKHPFFWAFNLIPKKERGNRWLGFNFYVLGIDASQSQTTKDKIACSKICWRSYTMRETLGKKTRKHTGYYCTHEERCSGCLSRRGRRKQLIMVDVHALEVLGFFSLWRRWIGLLGLVLVFLGRRWGWVG